MLHLDELYPSEILSHNVSRRESSVTGSIEEGKRGRVEWIVSDYWGMKNEGNVLADRSAHIGIR